MTSGDRKNKNSTIGKPLLENELKLFHQFFTKKFRGQMLSLDVITECWHKYNNGIWRIVQDGQIIAALDMWPVKKDFIKQLVKGKKGELSLTANQLDIDNSQIWFFGGIAKEEGIDRNKVVSLVIGFFSNWLPNIKNTIPISIYALGYSHSGIQLLNAFKYKVIEEGVNLKDGMDLYKRDINNFKELSDMLSALGYLN